MKEFVVPFSAKLRREINLLSQEHDRLRSERRFSEILEIYQKQYDLIRKYEEQLPGNLRYHKGAPLYNWGIFLISQNTPISIANGSEKLLLSYIEDILDYDTVKEANNLPAYGEIVKKFPHFSEIIKKILEIIGKLIQDENILKNPIEILTQAGYNLVSEEKEHIKSEIEKIQENIDNWLENIGPKDKRVFIGGSYKNIAVLKNISDIVYKLGYISVMACDCDFLLESPCDRYIHDTSIMLLKKCSYSIFEITISNGHLMEIERAKDFENLNVILVYQSIDPTIRPSITRMLMTTSYQKTGYSNFIQLSAILNNFLKGQK